MKNLTVLIVGVLLLTGCSNDDSIQPFEEQTSNAIYTLNQFETNAVWETIPFDELNSMTSNSYTPNAANTTTGVYTYGHYQSISKDGITITWSGAQNPDGSYGEAELIQETPNFSFRFLLKTECIMVEGNQVVYGGTITNVAELTGNAPNIGVGWRFYFKAVDSSGQNRYRTPDLIADKTFFASPKSISLCNVYTPNSSFWSSARYTKVTYPGYVVVGN